MPAIKYLGCPAAPNVDKSHTPCSDLTAQSTTHHKKCEADVRHVCDPCGTYTHGLSQFVAHIEGRAHAKRLTLLRAEQPAGSRDPTAGGSAPSANGSSAPAAESSGTFSERSARTAGTAAPATSSSGTAAAAAGSSAAATSSASPLLRCELCNWTGAHQADARQHFKVRCLRCFLTAPGTVTSRPCSQGEVS